MEKKRGRMNKKGAEMTIGTIIVIILALVVLVVIIYGFVTGWGSLWEKIIGIGGVGKPNIQTHVDSCKIACASDAKSDYCKPRNIIFEDNHNKTLNCEQLVNEMGVSVGLDACPVIDCGAVNPASSPPRVCENAVIWEGYWTDGSSICNKDTQVDITDNSLLLSSDKTEHPNQKCCVNKISSCSGTWITSDRSCDAGYYDLTFLLSTTAKTGHESGKCCVVTPSQ